MLLFFVLVFCYLTAFTVECVASRTMIQLFTNDLMICVWN